ncbi:MAG: D-hexose-6-phosphate mutarotase [Cyanobacteria bacterium P01_A01_bin.135]
MAPSLEQLTADYGIPGLRFTHGKADFPLIEIDNDSATATLSLYGGQVLAFQPKEASHPVLFLSDNAYFQPGKAIKGGAPICWPWFGPDPEGKGRPSHGFARNRMWNLVKTETTGDTTTVIMGLSPSEETQALWPQSFELAIEVTVGRSLSIALVSHNTGGQPFTMTQALHTYFTVGDIGQVKVLGLGGTQYIDKVDNGAKKSQSGDVTVTGEVDRIYLGVPPELVIDDPSLGRKIRVVSTGSQTAVVWNPWSEISAKSGDLTDDAYQTMICVETTNAADDVAQVPPGSEFRLTATYSVERS